MKDKQRRNVQRTKTAETLVRHNRIRKTQITEKKLPRKKFRKKSRWLPKQTYEYFPYNSIHSEKGQKIILWTWLRGMNHHLIKAYTCRSEPPLNRILNRFRFVFEEKLLPPNGIGHTQLTANLHFLEKAFTTNVGKQICLCDGPRCTMEREQKDYPLI